jgi:glycosyltransferase involved in cell wall biosynthesis
VHVIRHRTNRGEAHADNTGITEAKNPWVAFLDSDDEWLPNCLDSLWRGRGDYVLVAGKSIAFGSGPSVGRIELPVSDAPVVLRSPADIVFPGNFIAASGVMVKRDALIESGCFNPELKDAVDLDLWLRVLERGEGVVLPDVVARYRVHDAQATANRQRTMDAHERLLERYSDRPWSDGNLIDSWRSVRHWDDLRAGVANRQLVATKDAAAWLASHPRQWGKLGRLLRERREQRRRACRSVL